jgi:hypothetical protein
MTPGRHDALRLITASVMPPEVTAWAMQYRKFLSNEQHADPAIKHDDLLHDHYVLSCKAKGRVND